jgi:flagellar biosynthesis protein FlhF
MRIKTYYAQTMAEALRDIKAELGPDALLLSTKEIPSRSDIGGVTFEVVAAVDTRDPANLETGETSAEAEISAPADEAEDLDEAEPELYSKARLRSTPRRPQTDTALILKQSGSTAAALYRELIAAGVHRWLARRMVRRSVRILDDRQRRHRPSLIAALNSVAGNLIAIPEAGQGIPAKRVVAFVGPTGVGKTTTIAKLAARLTLQLRKKVVLLTLDGYRIGAVDQLRTYASLIGIPFRFVSDFSGLQAAIDEQSQRDYILIDTAGRGPRDSASMNALAALAEGFVDMERHLVVSATTRSDDLEKIFEGFAPSRPDHLVFTKVDETSNFGPVFNELVRTGKPLSYYTDGQRVPEDIHVLPKDRILDIVLNEV